MKYTKIALKVNKINLNKIKLTLIKSTSENESTLKKHVLNLNL